MRHKLVVWFAVLIAGFLTGFGVQYARLNGVQQELNAARERLAFCQAGEQLSQLRDTATLMYLETYKRTTERLGSTQTVL